MLTNYYVDLQKNNFIYINNNMQEIDNESVGTTLIADELISVTPEVEPSTIEDEINDAEIADDKELTDEEKKKLLIKQLKAAKLKFKPVKHNGKVTTNQFGATYKKKRAQKNKQAKASRRANRK
jgi:hypothetical protein